MGCRVFVCVLVLWVMALAGQAIAELNSGVVVAWPQPVLSGTVYGLPARVQGEQLTLMRQKLYDNDSKLNQTFWRHEVLAVTLEPQSTRIAFDDPRRTVEVLDVNPTPVQAVLSTGIPAINQSPGLLFSGRETIRLVMDTLTCMTGLKAHDTYTLCPSSASTQTLTVLGSSDAESTIMRHNPEKTPVPSLDAFDGLAVESTLAEEESDSHRPSLALRLTDSSRVQFEIEPTEASGQQVSFSVETVGASNGVGKSSTHAEPSSKSDNNNGDGKNHIPQSGTPSYPSETKSLGDRSAIQTNKITSLKLRELISENKFSNDVRYQVEGYLYLSDCTGLTALPENLSVGGDLYLDGCTGLTALPENLSVVGYLSLDGCTGLTALPENLSVVGRLSLRGCTGLTALPENLSVGRDLSLDGCTGLTALPENLSVEGYLALDDCTGLTALPENLPVGGDLYLGGCTGLTALPNWITTMGLTSQGSIRHVCLENSGLSDALIDRMRAIRTPNMQFHFSESAGQPEQQFSNLEQGFAFWRRLASSNSEIPELDLRHDQADDLVHYLGRLTSTADYQNQTSRPVLAQRVMAIMSLLAGNDRVRETALRHIHDALSSCDDRIILALDDLETLQLLTSAETLAFENRDPRKLKALGLQMMRLDAVKRFARDHMKTLSWVDAIEVELAFQIGVRQQLDLPGSTQNMIFRGCANVSDQDIANAVQHVNTHCSETQLEVYLAQWAPWQKFQRLLAAPSFDQLASTTVASIDDCFFSRKKTNKMVMLNDIHLDYDALVKAYLENGKNPFTNTPMDWSSVVRLIEEAPPLFKKRRLNDA